MRRARGEETAWRTLALERVDEPGIISSWCMKREFFQAMTGRPDIYTDPVRCAIEAFSRAGANLCPQLVMPSPSVEHIAFDPFGDGPGTEERPVFRTPEDVRDYIDALPKPGSGLDPGREAERYAARLMKMRDMAAGEMLFIGDFGQADFMGGYTRFGYENYLSAMALYPGHLKRYFEHSAEGARLVNLAIAEAVGKHKLAPFVYGGQDICYNDGPLCSLRMLDELYFPSLARSVEPLHEAGIRIIWHCDGDVRPILDRLIDRVGVSGLQGFQEETGCTLEAIASRRTREGRKLVIWGSVSVTRTLPFGSVDDVRADVERCFRVAGPGGGFFLASTSSILPETPLANILAMYDHGLKFGREFLGRA